MYEVANSCATSQGTEYLAYFLDNFRTHYYTTAGELFEAAGETNELATRNQWDNVEAYQPIALEPRCCA